MNLTETQNQPTVSGSASRLQGVVEGAKYLGILLGLVAFGYYGHLTHWTFGSPHSAEEVHENPTASTPKTDEELTSNGWEIEFPSENSLQRSGIKTSPIQKRPMREHVKAIGVVTYDERMSAGLSARVSGTVWKVVKQTGDAVHKGDVLVIVDAAEVGRAKAGFFSGLVDVESKSEIVSILETIPGAVSGRQVREARVALREAKIRLQNAEQTLVNLGFKVRKEAFEKLSDTERASKLQVLGLPESIVKNLDQSQTTSNLLALTAPFDGVLIRQGIAIGEMVQAGQPVVEVADLRHMWLRLDVPKEDAVKLTLGQPVRFSPDGLDRDFDGTVTWISTEMNEQTRTLQIRAEVENPVISSDPSTGREVRILRANTFGTGTIALRGDPAAYAVPTSAVLHADDQPMVFVRTGPLTLAGRCETGDSRWKLVQIESSLLKPDSEVVTVGCHVLKSEWILNHVASSSP